MNYTRITIHVFKLDDHSAAKPSCDVSFGIVSRSNGLFSPVKSHRAGLSGREISLDWFSTNSIVVTYTASFFFGNLVLSTELIT